MIRGLRRAMKPIHFLLVLILVFVLVVLRLPVI
jgi:hypothetical protein